MQLLPKEHHVGLTTLPPELVQKILGYLDLPSLVSALHSAPAFLHIQHHSVYQSSIKRAVTNSERNVSAGVAVGGDSDDDDGQELDTLLNLSAHQLLNIPPALWIPVLASLRADLILTELKLPLGLKEKEWEEAFARRFLPSWATKKKRALQKSNGKGRQADGEKWKALFLKNLWQVQHRVITHCGTSHSNEAYVKFISVERRGSASINRIRGRGLNFLAMFNQIKIQHNLASYPSQARLLVQLADVQIIAVGVLGRTDSVWLNENAAKCIHPPLLEERDAQEEEKVRYGRARSRSEGGVRLLSANRERSGISNGKIRQPSATTTTSITVTAVPSKHPPLASSSSFPSVPTTITRSSNLKGKTRAVLALEEEHLSSGSASSSQSSSPTRSSFPRPIAPSRRPTTPGPIHLTADDLMTLTPPLSRSVSASSATASPSTPSKSLPTAFTHLFPFGRAKDKEEKGRTRDLIDSRKYFVLPLKENSQENRETPIPHTINAATRNRNGASSSGGTITPMHHHTPPAISFLKSSAASTFSQSSLSLRLELEKEREYERQMKLLFPPPTPYSIMQHPQPSLSHELYPNYTPSDEGFDSGRSDLGLEEGRAWVGPLLLIAVMRPASLSFLPIRPDGLDLLPPPQQDETEGTLHVSFEWEDFDAILPWVAKLIPSWKREGGLGFLRGDGGA